MKKLIMLSFLYIQVHFVIQTMVAIHSKEVYSVVNLVAKIFKYWSEAVSFVVLVFSFLALRFKVYSV